jgi:opacity protein-like surface antigen
MFRKLLITLGILCLLSGVEAKADDTAYAYCPLGEGYVFLYDSVDGFQVMANLKCNEKVQVVDASDRTRTKVRTANGREGWVPKTSLNVPVAPKPSQAAVPESPVTQPPQAPAAPQPPVQPQRQPARQPQAKYETQQVNPAPPQPQDQPQSPVTQPQIPAPPVTVSQPQSATQAQNQPESETQPQAQEMPQSASQTQAQPQADVKLEAAVQPEAMPQPESQPQPEAQPAPESQPQPDAQPPLKAQTQLQQPPAAATAFTPFSSLGYEYVPRLEAYAGYSFLNAGTSGLAARQNVNGVEASFDVHINRWIAGELDGGAYIKTLDIINVGTFAYHNFMGMAGPRVNIRKAFFHALVGIDHLAGSANFYAVGNTLTDNALAVAGGGGVQWNVTRQLALRTSADYVLTRFEGLTQNNIRFTLGIVFQAGSVRAE